MPLSASIARMPARPCSRSATARSTARTPKPVNPAAAAASIRSRRGTGLRQSSRDGAASPAVVQHVASNSSAAVRSSIAPPGCWNGHPSEPFSEGAGVPLGLGGQLGVQRLGRPALLKGAPDEFGLGLGGQAADRLVAVEVGGEGVALGGGGDDVAQGPLVGAG